MIAIRAVLAALFLCLAPAAIAATFTVTSSAAEGPGTLHQAVLDANANPGRDQIRFAVAEATISPIGIPPVTGPVDIDGLLGDGTRVILTMPSAYDVNGGFKFFPGSSTSTLSNVIMGRSFAELIPNSAVLVHPEVSGIVVSNGLFWGSWDIAGDDNVFEESRIPLVGLAVRVEGDRNLFSENTLPTVTLFLDADSNRFEGNEIRRVTSEGTRLTLSQNRFTGLGEAAAVDIFGVQPPGTTITGNTIPTYVRGVVVRGGATGITITGNSIFNTTIPIDLGNNGPTPNDPAPDADTGPNNLQNFPVLSSATLAGGSLTVTGTLTSTPLLSYLVELFADNAADPEARTLLASFEVTADAAGTATFTRTITSPLPAADQVVTSTATNRLTGDTSEVSAAVAIDAPGQLAFTATTYTVNESDGTVTVTVNRTGGSEGTVIVQYATSAGSATAPADFTTTSGTLTFGPGVTSQFFNVPVVSDTIPEGEETFTVNLSNATGSAVLGTATATVVIASHLPEEAIPTASTWGLLIMTATLALIALRRG